MAFACQSTAGGDYLVPNYCQWRLENGRTINAGLARALGQAERSSSADHQMAASPHSGRLDGEASQLPAARIHHTGIDFILTVTQSTGRPYRTRRVS